GDQPARPKAARSVSEDLIKNCHPKLDLGPMPDGVSLVLLDENLSPSSRPGCPITSGLTG
ncbi:hypothetical protein, partial [Woodsholea maritima]|uniref:hypothetical protein n=1 Tax=Woodsholea maritima TaxID=240237 RepID=UPI001F1650BF